MINPRVDFAFKRIFESHEDLLISLINAVVSKKDQVSAIEIRNPYTKKKGSGDKYGILDIKAEGENGTYYNIEVQVTDDLHYDRRALYYWSKIYTEQLSEGQNYGELNKTIGIHLLNFNTLEEPDYHNVFHILNKKSKKAFTDMFEVHAIELKKVGNDLKKVKTGLDRWVTFLARAEKYTSKRLPKVLSQDKMIQKAMEVFETTRFDRMDREVYEARLKWLRDESTLIKSREKKAKEEGKKEGRMEEQAVLIRKLYKNGMNIKEIAKMTELSMKYICRIIEG